MKGREPVAPFRVDWVRRPRTCLASTHPGGPGSPSAGTMTGCLKWLDAARMKGGESCPDKDGGRPPVRVRKHGPGDRKAAMERREAPAFSQGDAAHRNDGCAAWRSIPLACREGKKEDGAARAANNRAGGALAG